MGKIIIIVYVILICGSCQAQNIKLTYEATFKPKLNDSLMKSEQMLLQIDKGRGISFFESTLSSESISLNNKIYKNFIKQSFIEYEPVAIQFYQTEYLFVPNWNLLNDTKMIMEFKCRKAEIMFGNREWIAWYSEDLPFQDGPYKFYGLPGLILEIFSKDGDYKFTATSVEKQNIIDFVTPTSTSLKIEKLNSLKEDAVKNPAAQFLAKVNMLKNSNMQATARYDNKEITYKDVEESMKKSFWDFIKSHDNPIEKGKLWTN